MKNSKAINAAIAKMSNQKVTYNHDTVLEAMLPKLSIMPCWLKRKYWSQSTNIPATVRHLAEFENLEATEK